MLSDEEIIKQKKKRKKIVLIVFCAIAGIFILFGLVTLILSGINNYIKNRSRAELDSSTYHTYVYPEADYNYNIFEDDFYMSQSDRNVYVTEEGATTVITEENYGTYSPEVQYMYNVIKLIIAGDYTGYNKIFTDDYLKNAGKDLRERFTMQQLFKINIEVLDSQESTADSKIYTDVQVDYRIRNNNGTFRNDLDFNDTGSIPVVYRLESNTDRTNIKVYGLLTYYKYSSGLY